MSLVDSWRTLAVGASFSMSPHFYCGCRKIIPSMTWEFRPSVFTGGKMEHFGYTKSKMSMLNRLYLHEESVATASRLWDIRLKKRKYGSVSFTTYSHLVKGNEQAGSKRRSIMGPCIQAGCLTLIPHEKATVIDLFYRTTELFKKFPADLVWLQDMVLPRFDLKTAPISKVRFHFANVTVHPMYAVVLYPHLKDPIRYLEDLRKFDERQWIWQVKWTARYLCDEYGNGIQKFSQALRVQHGAKELLLPATQRRIAEYCRKHHPGQLPSDDEDDDED